MNISERTSPQNTCISDEFSFGYFDSPNHRLPLLFSDRTFFLVSSTWLLYTFSHCAPRSCLSLITTWNKFIFSRLRAVLTGLSGKLMESRQCCSTLSFLFVFLYTTSRNLLSSMRNFIHFSSFFWYFTAPFSVSSLFHDDSFYEKKLV